MKRGSVMAIRMKPLPRRHRTAHLRALIRQQPEHSIRGVELAALLREEIMAEAGNEDRAV